MDTTVKNFIQTLKSLSWRFNEDIVRFIFLFEFCDITALLLSALNFRVAAWILLKSPSIVCPLPPLQMNAGAAVLKALLRVLMRRIWRWKGLLLFHNSFFFPVKKSLVTVKVKLPCIFLWGRPMNMIIFSYPCVATCSLMAYRRWVKLSLKTFNFNLSDLL